MSTAYRPVALKVLPRKREHETNEARYWKKFRNPTTQQEAAPVTNISFCPIAPYNIAVTSSTRIKLYSARTNMQLKAFSRFRDVAYSGNFRSDGKLICAGGEDPIVKVFDVGSRAVLRSFKGHTGAVRVAKWSSSNTRILSGSDDKTLRLWDLPGQEKDSLLTIKGHTDYIRSASSDLSMSGEIWATGSYDHTVKLWDMRGASSQKAMMTCQHDQPVEACLVMPGGSLMLSAAGNTISVWDLISGGKLLHSFSNHQKTITSLCLDHSQSRILSASLDGHVKIYDVASHQVTHGMKYQTPVLSLAVGPNNMNLVTGGTDGSLCVRTRKADLAEQLGRADGGLNDADENAKMRGGTYKYYARGYGAVAAPDSLAVEVQRKARLKPYDVSLKKFKYREALDAALETGQPLVVTSVLEELSHRDGLETALSGRNEATLKPLLAFLVKHISAPQYARTLVEACGRVLGLYASIVGQSIEVDELFKKLELRVKDEVGLQKEMFQLLGSLETIFASSAMATNSGGTK